MLTSKVTIKGQTTLPKAVQRQLGITAGDELVYEIDGNRVILEAKSKSIEDLDQILTHKTKIKLHNDEIDQIIRQRASRL